VGLDFYENKKVLVTGGASFIGSHLVDKLVTLGAKVTVIDNLSSGSLHNLNQSLPKITFIKEDLEYNKLERLVELFKGHEIVFHLAATHGGRGYISTHPADVTSILAIDHHVFEASYLANIEKVVYASSACVYPTSLQKDDNEYLLKEEDANPFTLEDYHSADIEYGWAKFMGEIQLISFIKQYGLKGTSLRFVTVYGPRENETHSIIALIYKAFEKMDPYVIWGDGNQSRDYTYVSDIVDGMLLAGEKVNDGTPINLGTEKKHKIREVAEKIFQIINWRPKQLIFDKSKPIGVYNRALSIEKARRLLGWEPKYSIETGLKETINWYFSTHQRKGFIDERLLLERTSK
jgi:UDP-glucose 4-epimerase